MEYWHLPIWIVWLSIAVTLLIPKSMNNMQLVVAHIEKSMIPIFALQFYSKHVQLIQIFILKLYNFILSDFLKKFLEKQRVMLHCCLNMEYHIKASAIATALNLKWRIFLIKIKIKIISFGCSYHIIKPSRVLLFLFIFSL